ncbi:MAG: hypothetical protein AAGA58_20190, partial [Verrucomicrobiota bacterium]
LSLGMTREKAMETLRPFGYHPSNKGSPYFLPHYLYPVLSGEPVPTVVLNYLQTPNGYLVELPSEISVYNNDENGEVVETTLTRRRIRLP